MEKKRYRWQPELAVSIIFWSATLMILFYSLTLSLENTRPYWKSNLIMVLFFVMVFLGGTRRWFRFGHQGLIAHYLLWWKNIEFEYAEIQKVIIDQRELTIVYQNKKYQFMMMRKTRTIFLKKLAEKIDPAKICQAQEEPEA